jgi:ABC-type Zn uptake system ZnuABC Zn-binding protein ZnuA
MKTFLLSLVALLAVAASAPAADKVRVSSFSTILTEIAQIVGGDRVDVTGHVKPGIDPHEFEPKPEDLKIIGNAQLVLLSAKHMESYVGKLKEATGTKGNLVEVGDNFASLKMKSEKDPEKVIEDPHWWHSVANAEKAVKVVRDELIKISPDDSKTFTDNAAGYLAKLDDLEKWTKGELAKLPRDKRKLVTSHDAFQYFARDNGFTIYPIEVIKSQGVKAIFPESIENPKVMQEITRETGVKTAPELYADGLGEGDASTYIGMYKHNVTTIVDALK